MILPTKRLAAERSLLSLGGEIIRLMDEPKTVSRTWEDFKHSHKGQGNRFPISYDWFVLSLDLLYAIGAIRFENGRIERSIR